MQYIQHNEAFPTLRIVLLRLMLLRQTVEHVGRAVRLLKKAACEILLVLSVWQTGVSEGARGGLTLRAP